MFTGLYIWIRKRRRNQSQNTQRRNQKGGSHRKGRKPQKGRKTQKGRKPRKESNPIQSKSSVSVSVQNVTRV